MTTEILYVPQMAKRLGRSKAAIRSAHQRKADWLPPAFHMGRLLAWRSDDVESFLKARAKKTAK